MADANEIRAGAAYVEISADDLPMQRRLKESQARLKRWAAENSGAMTLTRGTEAAIMGGGTGGAGGGGGGFLGGTFRGAEFANTGLKFAVAIQEARVAIGNFQIYSALARGDFEGMRKAAEALPFGLGAFVKEVSGPVDALARRVAGFFTGQDLEKAHRQRGADQGKRLLEFKAYSQIAEVERAIQRATTTAREYAQAEVAGMTMSADAAEKLLAAKLKLIAIDEQKKESAKLSANIARGQDAINQAMMEYEKLTVPAREYLRLEVQAMGLTADKAQQLLAWKQAILDVTEEQARAENRAWVEAQKGIAVYQEVIDNLNEREKVRKEGQSLEESLRTPEERAKAEIDKAQELFEAGAIGADTYNRAVRKALEDAAAAMPDVAARATIGVRGTFNAMEAAGMGAGGVADRIASATEKTAKNTEKIAQLAANLGVTYQ